MTQIQPGQFPQHDKMQGLTMQRDAVGEFCEFLESKGIVLCTAVSGGYQDSGLTTEALIAEFLGIDLEAFKTEKEEIFKLVRASARVDAETDAVSGSDDEEPEVKLLAPHPEAGQPFNGGPEFGGIMPGYVVGVCAHRVARSEWNAGLVTCERCDRNDYDLDGTEYDRSGLIPAVLAQTDSD